MSEHETVREDLRIKRALSTCRGHGVIWGLEDHAAREVVTAHGGQAWLFARTEGGAEAGFRLPRE